MTGAGLLPQRVAEVIVAGPPGRAGRRGSGYRVGDHWVLTAAHVVADAAAVRVRFEADRPAEWTAAARPLLLAEDADVALLELAGPVPAGPHAAPVEPPAYGAVPDADVRLPFSAVGFPRFKLRADHMRPLDDGSPSQYRDSCHATGVVSALSNRREGTLELAVADAPPDPEPGHSPWEGMSGAAVWHDGQLIGLVSAHHRSDGLGRLAAVRADRWPDRLAPPQLELLRTLAGYPRTRPELPVTAVTAEPAPGLAALAELPDNLPLRELAPLVDALSALPTVRDPVALAQVLAGIDPRVAANAPRAPALRPDLFALLRTCLRYPGTLTQLLEAVGLLEDDSAGVARLEQAAAALLRRPLTGPWR